MTTSIRSHEDRVALVTGAAQGIGQAIAIALPERGARVIATDLKLPQETVDKIGATGHTLGFENLSQFCTSILKKYGMTPRK